MSVLLTSGVADLEHALSLSESQLTERYCSHHVVFTISGCLTTNHVNHSVYSGELIAMKRCGPFRGNSMTVPLAFYTPESPGSHIYTLFIISQTYLGLGKPGNITNFP